MQPRTPTAGGSPQRLRRRANGFAAGRMGERTADCRPDPRRVNLAHDRDAEPLRNAPRMGARSRDHDCGRGVLRPDRAVRHLLRRPGRVAGRLLGGQHAGSASSCCRPSCDCRCARRSGSTCRSGSPWRWGLPSAPCRCRSAWPISAPGFGRRTTVRSHHCSSNMAKCWRSLSRLPSPTTSSPTAVGAAGAAGAGGEDRAASDRRRGQPGGRFLDRLPPRLGRDLLCLQMEDHYVRAHTARGPTSS